MSTPDKEPCEMSNIRKQDGKKVAYKSKCCFSTAFDSTDTS